VSSDEEFDNWLMLFGIPWGLLFVAFSSGFWYWAVAYNLQPDANVFGVVLLLIVGWFFFGGFWGGALIIWGVIVILRRVGIMERKYY
jgi:hypothetical protein